MSLMHWLCYFMVFCFGVDTELCGTFQSAPIVHMDLELELLLWERVPQIPRHENCLHSFRNQGVQV